MKIQVRDVVSYLGQDYVVEGVATWIVGGKTHPLARAVDGDTVLWVEPPLGGSCLGSLSRVASGGESRGPAVGGVIAGCPPRLAISVEEIQHELDRRRPGQSAITTQRREKDEVEILSGLHEGLTQGTP